MSDSSVLYEDEHFLVVHRPAPNPAPGSPTLITFADLTFRARDNAVWGQEPAAKLGLDVIGFVPKGENWYPAASVAKAAPAVRAALRGPAITYGYSMGGHAALKHAARLGAAHALAICPQDSIDPDEVPWDSRFHRFFKPALHGHMALLPGEAGDFAVMLADPYMPEDRGQAQRLARRGVHWVRTPFMDHAAIWLLIDSAFLIQVLERVMAQDLPGLVALMRARRHSSPHWARFMGSAAFRRGHLRMGNALWRRARRQGVPRSAISFEVQRALSQRVQHLRSVKQNRRARDIAMLQLKAWPTDAALHARVGHLMIGMKNFAESEQAFRSALALDPRPINAWQGLSLSLSAQKRRDEAIALCLGGIEQMPDHVELRMYLAQMLLKAGRADACEVQYRAVLEIDPHHAKALLGLSQTLAARGDRAEAVSLVRRLMEGGSPEPETCLWLGQLLLYVGEPAQAEPLYRAVVERDPDNADAQIGLARALERTGRLNAAQRVAHGAAGRMPDNPKLAALARRLGPPEQEEEEEAAAGPAPSRFRRWLNEFFSADA
ncbi:tetratricopeptide repeat protein [Pseudoroseomonas cervicalis]|uniref:Tetratricopeptide repeat protein n=1 Tax=Pseudoroseomonas cervicalis ATCC 49957 TaxID=525371 RepID=D5RI18_9PROT|nr:tetratricopeptide repeat protein [Pseudoroseomonas cervicalis]EFH13047.1 tetratricopeptide repeat protein [Pseudoroseomonas cervicalis ATCC 49957]